MSAPNVQRGRLVLCRLVRQRVVLRGDIVVELIAIEGDVVRLLCDAPTKIPILREELIPKRHRLLLPPPKRVTDPIRSSLETLTVTAADPPPLRPGPEAVIGVGIEIDACVSRVRIGSAGFDPTVLGEALAVATRLSTEWRSRGKPCLDQRLLAGSPLTRQSAEGGGGGARRQWGRRATPHTPDTQAISGESSRCSPLSNCPRTRADHDLYPQRSHGTRDIFGTLDTKKVPPWTTRNRWSGRR